MTERLRHVIMNTMKSTTTPVPTVKESVSQGIPVMLPNILDDYLATMNTQVPRYGRVQSRNLISDDVIQYLSYECATENDISATEAEDVIRYTLAQLGVEL